MSSIRFECVTPTEEHARLVMQWRNDPVTLAASFHQEPKLWESFYPEFCSNYFTIPSLQPLFACIDGERAAFLRFRPHTHPTTPRLLCPEISIMVAPEHRGKGVATRALQEVQSLLKARGVDAVFAEIKTDNPASVKAFEKAGYKHQQSIAKSVADTGETYQIHQYLLPLREHAAATESSHVTVIAEAGSNWRMGTPARDMAMAKSLIEVAAEAGADAVKFQVFRPDSVYVSNAGTSDYLSDAGIQEDISDIFADLAMPYEMLPDLAAYCAKCDIDFMASPFSVEDFEAIDPHVSAHKIASYEISHLRLIEAAARSGKPTIMSTGAAEEGDIAWAVDTFYANGGGELTLLQCTAKYPATADSMNLRVIPWLQQRFGVRSGLSDHSADPVYAPLAAVALGATCIEKHYTLDKRLPGPDHAFAIAASELKQLVDAVRVGEQMLGTGQKVIHSAEEELHSYARRGVQAIRDIDVGDTLEEGSNVAILRPGKQQLGLHPKHLPQLEGCKASQAIKTGHGIDWPAVGTRD